MYLACRNESSQDYASIADAILSATSFLLYSSLPWNSTGKSENDIHFDLHNFLSISQDWTVGMTERSAPGTTTSWPVTEAIIVGNWLSDVVLDPLMNPNKGKFFSVG